MFKDLGEHDRLADELHDSLPGLRDPSRQIYALSSPFNDVRIGDETGAGELPERVRAPAVADFAPLRSRGRGREARAEPALLPRDVIVGLDESSPTARSTLDRTVTYSMGVSLDGYIVGPADGVLGASPGESRSNPR